MIYFVEHPTVKGGRIKGRTRGHGATTTVVTVIAVQLKAVRGVSARSATMPGDTAAIFSAGLTPVASGMAAAAYSIANGMPCPTALSAAARVVSRAVAWAWIATGSGPGGSVMTRLIWYPAMSFCPRS